MANKGKQKTVQRKIKVTAQTAFNLDKLAALSGLKTPGRVVDKLVRNHMVELNANSGHLFEYAEHGFVDEAYFDSGLCEEVRKRLNIW